MTRGWQWWSNRFPGGRDQLGDTEATALAQEVIASSSGGTRVEEFLTRWQQTAGQPTVLLLDEVNALVGDTLISLLRQLRAGYPKRPAQFPQTVILCGVRDLRDYRIHASSESAPITGFNEVEVAALLQQHTAETRQAFTPAAFAIEPERVEAPMTPMSRQGEPWWD